MENCDPLWINDMRNILIGGMLLVIVLLGILNWPEKKEATAKQGPDGRNIATKAYCPLHRKIIGECPPGSHDNEGDS